MNLFHPEKKKILYPTFVTFNLTRGLKVQFLIRLSVHSIFGAQINHKASSVSQMDCWRRGKSDR